MKISADNIAIRLLTFTTCLALLAGCASTPEPKPYQIQANADPVINRDISGKQSPRSRDVEGIDPNG